MRHSFPLGLGLSIALIVAAVPAFAQPYHKRVAPSADVAATAEYKALVVTYDRAIFDSSVYESKNVRPLRPLTPDSNGEVLVSTLTSLDGAVGTLLPVTGSGVWVTGVPEVFDRCQTFTGDVVMQLRQLIGLPPDAHIPRVLVLRVKATDLFRPAVVPDISTTLPCTQMTGGPVPPSCGNVYPPDTTAAHYEWMATQSFALHELPSGYPWTHLGYTYNWAPNEDRYGASEYLIRAGANALILQNTDPVTYCKPPS